MSSLFLRLYRWRKRLMLAMAGTPLMMVNGGCDPFVINQLIGQQLASAAFSVFVGSIQQVMLRSFPSSDVIQILLGGNRQPFFPF